MLVTAHHKVMIGESESTLKHRYAVVVQDLFSFSTQSNKTMNNKGGDTKKSAQQFMLFLDRHTLNQNSMWLEWTTMSKEAKEAARRT